MKYHTAPAAALKALESAARHLSFTRAAQELNVTQSAISHQIRHLEDLWDVKLFRRQARRLELTTAGGALAPVVRDFFTRLEDTLDGIHRDGTDNALRVECLPSVAVKWLVPRLQEFRDAHPEIDVWLSTANKHTVDFDNGNADLAIHMGDGAYPGLDSWYFMDDHVFPVCRPRFLQEHGWPETPADLLNYPLLLRFHEITSPSWEYWFDAVGIPQADYASALREGTHYPDSNMALQAAFEGQGVALGRRAHVWDDLKSGRMVHLFPEYDIRLEVAYYIVCPKGRIERPIVRAFRDWLISEGKAFSDEYTKAA